MDLLDLNSRGIRQVHEVIVTSCSYCNKEQNTKKAGTSALHYGPCPTKSGKNNFFKKCKTFSKHERRYVKATTKSETKIRVSRVLNWIKKAAKDFNKVEQFLFGFDGQCTAALALSRCRPIRPR